MLPVTAENRMLGRASLSTSPDVDRVRPVPQQIARRRAFWRAEWFLFVLFVAPNLLLFGIFSYWPMISNLYLSLGRWDRISPVKTFDPFFSSTPTSCARSPALAVWAWV